MEKSVDQILALEDKYKSMDDLELKEQTAHFKARLAKGETLDDLLIEAFAVVREAADRVLNMRHFPVQLMGGMVLHEGNIAEMKTGEGKTLVSTLPAYLNALEGHGVFIITVNDYLASRDSHWMGKVHEFLGLSVGLVVNGLSFDAKKEAYNADITYGTNNEFGFDYLRDNMVGQKVNQVQRELNYAIIDEVDSVLVDEARTPLIISGSGDKSTQLYKIANAFVRTLKTDDYEKDEKTKSTMLTDTGVEKAEKYFSLNNLADVENMEISHNINQALHANVLMHKDRDYIVKEGEIIIIDEFTGRQMPGRRYSNGLHQAIEAKENVRVNRESKTLATITFQNYFRMFNKLAGMTGTAKTEEEEFQAIYNLNVVTMPTNKPMIRNDMNDLIYKTESGKINAITQSVKERHSTGQPVLVGTISIEKSELLSRHLKKEGIKHNVLNAKYLEKEAEIVANAGQRDAVTISTNMAGRGTDIVLGEGVPELGGLHIIGTERHESRRIDNQLRGRAGRQGDPGSSQFFVSLEDDLMRVFGGDWMMNLMNSLGFDEETPIEHKRLTKGIEGAQKKVEAHNFDIRKNVLQYDNVMNRQREIIYGQRQKVIDGQDMHEQIWKMTEDTVKGYVDMHTGGAEFEDWAIKDLKNYFEKNFFGEDLLTINEDMTKEDIIDEILSKCRENYDSKVKLIGDEAMQNLERVILLRSVDSAWMEHIDNMAQLKQGIGLRAYGQNDPVKAYTNEGFALFEEMTMRIQEETVKYIYNVKIKSAPQNPVSSGVDLSTTTTNSSGQNDQKNKATSKEKVGRNAPCPCGSGKKYKHCCGA